MKQNPIKLNLLFLPNLLTCMTLFLGCFAMMKAIEGAFHQACFAVLMAMFFDFMDGRVARLTNTISAFGAQFDSLADLVAFGCAPAFIALEWHLRGLKDFWPVLAFIWIGAVAIRLAKFNAKAEESASFFGMPCPSAAAMLVGYVGCQYESPHFFSTYGHESVIVFLMLISSCAMVSRIPFPSLKKTTLPRKQQYMCVFFMLLCLSALALKPFLVLFTSSLTYFLYSLLQHYCQRRRSPC